MNQPTEPLSQHPTDPRFQGIPSDPLDKVFTTLLMEKATDGVWYDNEGTPSTDLVKEAKEVIKAHLIELVKRLLDEDKLDLDADIPAPCYNDSYWSGAWEGIKFSREALIKAIEGGSNG